MEDKKISEAIKLLYKGAKMLPYHCPECGIPIFKYEDKMICPSCGREAVFENELKDKKIDSNRDVVEENLKGGGREKIAKSTHNTVAGVVGNTETARKELVREEETVRTLTTDFRDSTQTHLEESKYENYDVFKQTLKLKLNDISKMLLNATSPDEIERFLSLSERIVHLLKEVEEIKEDKEEFKGKSRK